jgi:ribulose-5-phosphate 4-epimerase/fuculose-1-phosphate aldolase
MSIKITKREVIECCRMLYNKGFVAGSGGNISVRIGEHVLITPTGYSLSRLTEDDLSLVDLDGNLIEGLKPSKELDLHLKIYNKMEYVQAVIHTHSVYSICAGIMAENEDNLLPPYTPGFAAKVGRVGFVGYFKPGSMELAEAVASSIFGKKAVILKNHGLITIGKDLEEALNVAEDVEENAKIHILVGSRGKPLSEENVRELLSK